MSSNNDIGENKSNRGSETSSHNLMNESLEIKKSEPTRDSYEFDNYQTQIRINFI